MEIITTPPIKISPVTDTVATWQYVEGQAPVDFTAVLDGGAWSAEFLLESCGTVKYRTLADLDSSGYVSVKIPREVADSLRSHRRIDATYQVKFTSPLPDLNEVWKGPVVVLEITS